MWSRSLGLVILFRVDGELGNDLSGVNTADGRVAVVDEYEHGGTVMGSADSKVADLSGVTEGDFPVLVYDVGSGAPFAGVVGFNRRGFR